MRCIHRAYFLCLFSICVTTLQFLPERIFVAYSNPDYLNFINASLRQTGRGGSVLANVHYTLTQTLGNNVSADVTLYELMSNEYRKSFVQLKGPLCDTVFKNFFIGPLVAQTELVNKTCPFTPGIYRLTNVTFPSLLVPDNFPFRKGRADLEFIMLGPGKRTKIAHVQLPFQILGATKSSKRRRDKGKGLHTNYMF